MDKRKFYVDLVGDQPKCYYWKSTLRNIYIKWNILKYGIPEELPDGNWIVTLSWEHSRIIPGLRFDEA